MLRFHIIVCSRIFFIFHLRRGGGCWDYLLVCRRGHALCPFRGLNQYHQPHELLNAVSPTQQLPARVNCLLEAPNTCIRALGCVTWLVARPHAEQDGFSAFVYLLRPVRTRCCLCVARVKLWTTSSVSTKLRTTVMLLEATRTPCVVISDGQ